MVRILESTLYVQASGNWAI